MSILTPLHSSFTSQDLWRQIKSRTSMCQNFGLEQYVVRHKFCQEFAWAIPSENAISEIASFVQNGKVLEIGAGNGLWARLLFDIGVDITATDDFSWNGTGKMMTKMNFAKFFQVDKMDSFDAVQRYAPDVLMFVWPPLKNDMASKALKEFKGNKIVYIGEFNGCTGDDDLHDILCGWNESGHIQIPQWDGLHDCLMFFER